jgi:hypothetical protein
VALLPSGAVGIARLDAPAMFQSQFGPHVAQLVGARLPVPPSAGFDPARDLSAVYVGFYSMQGADFAGVATGAFHPAAIAQAADGTTMTPLGAPLVKTSYARTALYVSRNVGFAVLTEHTVLFGNETGIRRALDRLSEGRAKHDLVPWVDSLLQTPNAAMVVAIDLAGQPPVAAAVRGLSFINGMKTGRIVGNFQPPGMNFAGTLSYPTPEAAQAAAASMNQANQMVQSYGFALQFMGIGNPIQNLQTSPNGNDTQFAVGVEGKAVDWALAQAATMPLPALQPGTAYNQGSSR